MHQLTIGMGMHGEPDNTYFTLQAFRTYHGDDFDLVVVDNTPQMCMNTRAACAAAGASYYHRPDLNGTSRPRDAVFHFSQTPWTMIVDNHVLLEPGAVDAAIHYAELHPDSIDLLSGPMVGDNGRWCPTHWNQPHPPGLWGEWRIDEAFAAKWGTDKIVGRAAVDTMEPFEIPMMGLGLFYMRTAAWPGFNRHFRGFGGEEGYIHEKVRQLGGKCLCHPSIRWRHKFRNLTGPAPARSPYPASDRDHLRNMVIGHRELGIDPEVIRRHFGKKTSDATWKELTDEATRIQPVGITPRPAIRILGIFYTHNQAPAGLIEKSMKSIVTAAKQSRYPITLSASVHQPVIGDMPQAIFNGKKGQGHATIAAQMRQAIEAAKGDFDVVVFLEHDVLYAAGYFDAVGDAFADNPDAPVVFNQDYIGLNATGWLKIKELHAPLHQLSLRWNTALANLARAEADCVRQGWSYLEPDSEEPKQVSVQFAEFQPGLWVGEKVSQAPLGTAAVLNLMEDPNPEWPGIEQRHRPISDDHVKPAPSLEWLVEQVTWVESVIDAGKNTYIHCRGGVSRSGLVAVAYIMKSRGVGREVALTVVRDARPQVAPRPAFWSLLAQYEKTLPTRVTTTSGTGKRDRWFKIPAYGLSPNVHVNHVGPGGSTTRLTSHGEVVYERVSTTLGQDHPYWGEAVDYWPGLMEAPMGCGSCNKANQPVATNYPVSLVAWVEAAAKAPSDFHAHVMTLQSLAANCNHVTQIGMWGKPSRIALAAGTRDRFIDMCPFAPRDWDVLQYLMGDRFTGKNYTGAEEIEPTELLFLDLNHTADSVLSVLSRHYRHISHYIVIHCTVTFGENGDLPGLGVMPGIRTFLRDHPEWTAIRHDKNNHGLIVLSCAESDKKQPPGLIRKGMNYARALAKDMAAGQPRVTQAVFEERMDHCVTCEYRCADTCGACGCPLESKLSWATEECGRSKLSLPVLWGPVTDPAGIET